MYCSKIRKHHFPTTFFSESEIFVSRLEKSFRCDKSCRCETKCRFWVTIFVAPKDVKIVFQYFFSRVQNFRRSVKKVIHMWKIMHVRDEVQILSWFFFAPKVVKIISNNFFSSPEFSSVGQISHIWCENKFRFWVKKHCCSKRCKNNVPTIFQSPEFSLVGYRSHIII